MEKVRADAIAASAHKFHGPNGVGFLSARHGTPLQPLIHGGSHERNMRGGTENVAGIVGLAKAFEIAAEDMETDQEHILGLKMRMVEKISETIPGTVFNGLSATPDRSLYTVINLTLPPSDKNDMLLFQLDLEGICASGGSACNSGASTGSHVLSALGKTEQAGTVRFSFSKFNTVEDVDRTVETLKDFCAR
jgi:cysteine desulfurase